MQQWTAKAVTVCEYCNMMHFGTRSHSVQVKPVYTYVHSQHHQIGSAVTTLGRAFGDSMDVGLCFMAFHLALGLYLHLQPAWNIAAVALLIIAEVRQSLPGQGLARAVGKVLCCV